MQPDGLRDTVNLKEQCFDTEDRNAEPTNPPMSVEELLETAYEDGVPPE